MLRRRTLLASAALAAPALAQPAGAPLPDALRRGLNLTNWFRFPVDPSPAALRAYMPDAALQAMRRAGFTFIRLCIQPQVLLQPDGSLQPERLAVVLEAIARLRDAGLAVMVDAHPETWRPERRPEERQGLLDFWRGMAPRLAGHDPDAVFVEIMNEPVHDDHATWWQLQEEALAVIRAVLPHHLVVVTGAEWGSIEGLLRLPALRDRNLLYSVHDYTPGILTHMASWERGHDRAALARLPFPVADAAACHAQAARTDHARTRELGAQYCAEGWDAARVQARLSLAADWARRAGAPVALLEFGAHAELNTPARLAYLEAVRRATEALGMGWALWGYADIMGFRARQGPTPAELDAPTHRAPGLSAA